MQRGGRGNGDFFGFGDPFAGFEGFGRSGSLFANAFGGRDPFDDPFFTRPFGSFMGPGMFGPSIFDTLRSPFEHTQNTGFLENQAPSHNSARGPIIQELDPDEDEVSESLSNVSQDHIREHHTSGEPRIQHPDEETEDVGKNNHIQYMHNYTGSGPSTAQLPQPQRSAYTFHSSSMTYGGTNGAYYTSSTTRRTGSDGVTMEERKEADVTTGKATHMVSRGLHGKGHSVTRKLNADGKVDTMQTLHNLNEDELAGFEEAWKGNAVQHLPGWNHDADMLYSRNGRGTAGGLALPFRGHQRQESGGRGLQTNPQGNPPSSRRIYID